MASERKTTPSIQLIADILESSAGKGNYVIVGGAAMYVHGIKNEFPTDIDVYSKNANLNTSTKVDMTDDEFIWGQFRIGDVNKSQKIYSENGINISVISIETLFIIKADISREKDIEHLQTIKLHTTPNKIIDRARELSKFNNGYEWSMVAENLLLELQAQYMVPVSIEWIRQLGLSEDHEMHLIEAFDIEIPSNDESIQLKEAFDLSNSNIANRLGLSR